MTQKAVLSGIQAVLSLISKTLCSKLRFAAWKSSVGICIFSPFSYYSERTKLTRSHAARPSSRIKWDQPYLFGFIQARSLYICVICSRANWCSDATYAPRAKPFHVADILNQSQQASWSTSNRWKMICCWPSSVGNWARMLLRSNRMKVTLVTIVVNRIIARLLTRCQHLRDLQNCRRQTPLYKD